MPLAHRALNFASLGNLNTNFCKSAPVNRRSSIKHAHKKRELVKHNLTQLKLKVMAAKSMLQKQQNLWQPEMGHVLQEIQIYYTLGLYASKLELLDYFNSLTKITVQIYFTGSEEKSHLHRN